MQQGVPKYICRKKRRENEFKKSIVLDPDPHNQRKPGSGSAWTDADPDSVGEKLRKKTKNCRYK